jgi:lysophospholipase L1-like esterase
MLSVNSFKLTSAFLLVTALLAGLPVVAAKPADNSSAKWEKDIHAFEVKDSTNPPPKNAVLFVGSSSIRFWPNLAASFPDMTTIQRGFGGSCIPDSTAFADRIILPYHPAKIVLYAGDNDIARGDSAETVYHNFLKFERKIHSALPETPIYYIAIKPCPSRWHLSPQIKEANHLIQKYCDSHKNLVFIHNWKQMLNADGQPDRSLFRPDMLHLNAKGYALWTKIIGDALRNSPKSS